MTRTGIVKLLSHLLLQASFIKGPRVEYQPVSKGQVQMLLKIRKSRLGVFLALDLTATKDLIND